MDKLHRIRKYIANEFIDLMIRCDDNYKINSKKTRHDSQKEHNGEYQSYSLLQDETYRLQVMRQKI